MGIKLPVYAQSETGWVFASELKASASRLASAKISPTSVAAYLSMGSVPSPLTIHHQEISTLELAT